MIFVFQLFDNISIIIFLKVRKEMKIITFSDGTNKNNDGVFNFNLLVKQVETLDDQDEYKLSISDYAK